MPSDLSNLSVEHLRRALVLKQHIEDLERELAGILGGKPAPGKAPRRRISAQGLARIAAAQRRRWAAHRKAAAAPAISAPAGRRQMSPAARARIAAAARARWRAAKAAGRTRL